jgi:hypothetical protein
MRWHRFAVASLGIWIVGWTTLAFATEPASIEVVVQINLPQAEEKWQWTAADFDRVRTTIASETEQSLEARYPFWLFSPQSTASEYQLVLKIVDLGTSGVRLLLDRHYEGETFTIANISVVAPNDATSFNGIPPDVVIKSTREAFANDIVGIPANDTAVRNFVHLVPVGSRSKWIERSSMKLAVELPLQQLEHLKGRQFLVLCSKALEGGGTLGGYNLRARGAMTTQQIAFGAGESPVTALIVVALKYQDPSAEHEVPIDSSNTPLVGDLQPGPVLLPVSSEPTSSLIAATVSDADQ